MISIRNLTSIPIELKLIERYEKLPSRSYSLYGAATQKPLPTTRRLDPNIKSFARRELSLLIHPFKTSSTDIDTSGRAIDKALALTFELDGQRYRILTPAPNDASQTLEPLDPQPKYELTGIYLSGSSWLSIYSSHKLQAWMQHLHDATPLSALSIPGTHNSAACRHSLIPNTNAYDVLIEAGYRALPSVRCQCVSIRTQLDNGVRFLDIRVQPESAKSPSLVIVHGAFPVSFMGAKHFRDLLRVVYTFLDSNPSETVILSVKREGVGPSKDEDLCRVLIDHYIRGADLHYWYVDPRIPMLGAVRGKVVLMRRFGIDDATRTMHGGRGWAIDAQAWANNTPHDLHGEVCVQDFYEVLETRTIEQKISYVEAHFRRAAECVCHLPGITTDATHPVPPQPFYLNFLSASNFWRSDCWPEKIAKRLNPSVIAWLCEKHHQDEIGDGGTGIVVCDWVGHEGDWDLVRCIVGMNAKLMCREMSL